MRDDTKGNEPRVGDQVIVWRRQFHQYPEPGFGEFRTANVISDYLKERGFTVRIAEQAMDRSAIFSSNLEQVEKSLQRAVVGGLDADLAARLKDGGTAVVADLRANPGPLVGFRFDMDALPIAESEEVDHRPSALGFRSRHEGLMHACGHDGHMAMGLGIATVLADKIEQLQGGVRLIFQPAEEGTMGGAAAIAARGLVDDVDYMICAHLGLGVPTGEVVCQAHFLATSKYQVEFEGAAAHVTNSPQTGRNALLAAASAALALHAISPHSDGWFNLNVGVLSAGDEQGVTPAWAKMKLGFWAETSEIHDYVDQSVMRIIEGSANTWGVRERHSLIGQAPTAAQDDELAAILRACAQGTAGVVRVTDSVVCKAGEDANVFLREVAKHGGKGIYAVIGSDLQGGHHSSSFDFDEASLAIGVSLLSQTCLTLLEADEGRDEN